MIFNYKTNFEIKKQEKEFINHNLKEKQFYINNEKIIVSIKFPRREASSDYDCFIALEVLEHIYRDKSFLQKIPIGKWVFITVPAFHAFNHVRAFLTPDSIAYRYKKILDIKEIYGCVKERREKQKQTKTLLSYSLGSSRSEKIDYKEIKRWKLI